MAKVHIRMLAEKLKLQVAASTIRPLARCGLLVEREAKLSMRPGGGKGKVPSLPGTPPHAQEGILRASISHAATTRRTEVVGPTKEAPYGKVHEFGGKKHPQRAFMRPALRKMAPLFPKQFRGTV